jgi:hypothetical protein
MKAAVDEEGERRKREALKKKIRTRRKTVDGAAVRRPFATTDRI